MRPTPESAKIDFSKLSPETLSIAEKIFKKDGTLYSSKPTKANGDQKYVWRQVAFFISKKPQHQCMPVTASFDLETYDDNGKWSSHLAHIREKELNTPIKEILDAIPVFQQAGLLRWARAFGRI